MSKSPEGDSGGSLQDGILNQILSDLEGNLPSTIPDEQEAKSLPKTNTSAPQELNENRENKIPNGESKDLKKKLHSAFKSDLEKNVPLSGVSGVETKKVFVNKLVVDLEKTLIGLDTRIGLSEKTDDSKPTPKPVKTVRTDVAEEELSISYTKQSDTLEDSIHVFEERQQGVQKSVKYVPSDLIVAIEDKVFEIIKHKESTDDLKSALAKDVEKKLLETIPSEEDLALQLIEDLEETLYDEGQNHWTRVPLRPEEKVIQPWTDRIVSSDHGINYKLTERAVPELEDKGVVNEEAASVPVSVHDYEFPAPRSYPIEKTIHPEPERVLSLNDFQVTALQGLLNLGIDIENSGLLDILQPSTPVILDDWETLVAYNRLEDMPPENPSFCFMRDKTRRNAPELSRAVRRYIAHVLALKYRRERGVDKTQMKETLKRMKKDVIPMIGTRPEQEVMVEAKQKNKVVVRLGFNNEKALYSVLSQNINIGDLRKYVTKHLKIVRDHFKKDFVDHSNDRGIDVLLSDDTQEYKDDAIFLRDLPKLDVAHCIISLRVEFAATTKEEPLFLPQEPCKPKPDNRVKGYRHRTTNLVYYHACSQTVREFNLENLVSREAQTPAFPLRETATVTMATTSTQMDRENYRVDDRNDRILCPGRWVSNPAYDVRYQTAMAMRIQRQWRNYLTLKYEQELRDVVARLGDNEIKMRNRMEESSCVLQMRAMLSPLYLNRKEDAYMLYIFLQSWWKNRKNSDGHRDSVETLRRKSCVPTKCTDEKKACATRMLLEEFKAFLKRLIAIEKSVTKLRSSEPDRVELKQLNETVMPLKSDLSKGAPITIVTAESQRCSQLKNLYDTLRRRDSTLEERVDLLMHVREFLINKNKEVRLSERILSLINKEIDYLNHSIGNGAQIEPLRRRIELHFLKYVTSRAVNPNMGKLLDKKCPPTCGSELHLCNHCLKTKHADQFQTEKFSDEVLRMCKSCFYVRELGTLRVDFSQYTTMLTRLRHVELTQCTLSPVAFLIHEETVHRILTLWGFRSPISGCEDLFKLRLARWIIHLDWTPWNNILLTEEEAANHVSVRHVHSLYSSAFVRNVWRINMNARQRFGNLRQLEYCVKNILVMQGTALDDDASSDDELHVSECA